MTASSDLVALDELAKMHANGARRVAIDVAYFGAAARDAKARILELEADKAALVEAARQRAIVLFQEYARSVAEQHDRSEPQFMHDVETFIAELNDAFVTLAKHGGSNE